jgi:hypothetical protein
MLIFCIRNLAVGVIHFSSCHGVILEFERLVYTQFYRLSHSPPGIGSLRLSLSCLAIIALVHVQRNINLP